MENRDNPLPILLGAKKNPDLDVLTKVSDQEKMGFHQKAHRLILIRLSRISWSIIHHPCCVKPLSMLTSLDLKRVFLDQLRPAAWPVRSIFYSQDFSEKLLLSASAAGDAAHAQRLLLQKANVDSKDHGGRTALHLASGGTARGAEWG